MAGQAHAGRKAKVTIEATVVYVNNEDGPNQSYELEFEGLDSYTNYVDYVPASCVEILDEPLKAGDVIEDEQYADGAIPAGTVIGGSQYAIGETSMIRLADGRWLRIDTGEALHPSLLADPRTVLFVPEVDA